MSLRSSLLGIVVPAMRLHESFANQLVHDLSEEQMDFCPGPGHENTPRFTLGHLLRRGVVRVSSRASGA